MKRREREANCIWAIERTKDVGRNSYNLQENEYFCIWFNEKNCFFLTISIYCIVKMKALFLIWISLWKIVRYKNVLLVLKAWKQFKSKNKIIRIVVNIFPIVRVLFFTSMILLAFHKITSHFPNQLALKSVS